MDLSAAPAQRRNFNLLGFDLHGSLFLLSCRQHGKMMRPV
jgi:hypothetical protein